MRIARVLTVLGAAFLVLALPAGVALAGIAGGPHDVTVQVTGKSVCEPCHLPHGAGAQRLWADTKVLSGGGWEGLVVSPLCGSCHYGTPYNAAIPAHDMTNYAYTASSHGFVVATLDGLVGSDNAAASGLPYVNQTNIQCSSCHNPHENAVRPFMRVASGSVQTLCVLCHGSRNNLSGSGTSNGTGTNVNDSMHPNNTAYPAPSAVQYDPNMIASSDANWQELFANTRGTAGSGSISVATALGGKLLDAGGTSGNYGCPTCHAVHGSNTGATTGQFDHVLAANNNVSAQNGNKLCEGCHRGGVGGGLVLVSGGEDHPIDNLVSGRASGTFDFAPWADAGRVAYESVYTLWPKNQSLNQSACTSCHSAHYGVGTTPMQRSGGTADWCNSCHTAASKAPPGHHSTVDILASSLITCGDCHRTSAPNTNLTTMSAHRGFAALDVIAGAPVSGWRSRFCLKCHGDQTFDPLPTGGTTYTGGTATGQTGVFNPTGSSSARLPLPATHGNEHSVSGLGSSHFVGNISNIAGDNVTKVRTATWGTYGGLAVYSMYGTSTGTLRNNNTTAPTLASGDQVVCESCHSVRYNAFIDNSTAYSTSGMNGNLLLYAFIDDGSGQRSGASPAATTGSVLCVGCHIGGDVAIATLATTTAGSNGLNIYKPAGTHPVTNSIVTKANDVNRSQGVRLITGTGTYADCTVIAPMSYPNTDEMDCDSCHRAHDGAPNSATSTFNYILEEAAATNNVQSMCTYCHMY